jgi:hypothetical protein
MGVIKLHLLLARTGKCSASHYQDISIAAQSEHVHVRIDTLLNQGSTRLASAIMLRTDTRNDEPLGSLGIKS